ncbi:MAG: hypothetical protein WBA13_11975 [Microcoleaceae cyanobacterium]
MTEMLRDGSMLLLPLKQYADQLLADSDKIQNFLADIDCQVQTLECSQIKSAALRAFYFDIDFDIDENRTVALRLYRTANYLVCGIFFTRILDGVSLKEGIKMAQNYDAEKADSSQQIMAASSANTVMLIAIDIASNSQKIEKNEKVILKQLLQRLQEQVDDDEVTK